MNTLIVFLTLIMLVRLGLPERPPTLRHTSLIGGLLCITVILTVEMNLGAWLLLSGVLLTHTLSELAFKPNWRSAVRSIALVDYGLLWLLLTLWPSVHLEARDWISSLSGLELKYIGIITGGLVLARETQWAQKALLGPTTHASISSIAERGLMYAGLVVGLPYWWLLGVLIAKGFVIKQQPAVQATTIWASSVGSALTTLLVFDLLHRGLAG